MAAARQAGERRPGAPGRAGRGQDGAAGLRPGGRGGPAGHPDRLRRERDGAQLRGRCTSCSAVAARTSTGCPRRSARALRVAFGMAEGGRRTVFSSGWPRWGCSPGRPPAAAAVPGRRRALPGSGVADTLAFVARRLHADAIAIVFAVREPARLPGRAGRAARAPPGRAGHRRRPRRCSRRRPGRGCAPPVADRIIAETGGNPLALIEIGQELAGGELDGDPFLPEPLPLGRQLEQRYLREIRELPAATAVPAAGGGRGPDRRSQPAGPGRPAAGLHPGGGRRGRGPAAHHHPALRSASVTR